MLNAIRQPANPTQQGATCPECEMSPPTGTPAATRLPSPDPDHLLCMACGHDWTEDDPVEVARAWYGLGAYEHQRSE